MERPFVAHNDAERVRLRALIERISDEDLMRPMPAGWTIAGILAHLAFWDARVLYFTDKWANGTDPAETVWGIEDVDSINDPAKQLCLGMPPRAAAQLALEMAEAADQRVASLSDDLLEKATAGLPFSLSRANHRREHLDEIAHAHPDLNWS
ncbi:MAG: DinB family protein [bacterium]|nr:DinB family protein [bacterium]